MPEKEEVANEPFLHQPVETVPEIRYDRGQPLGSRWKFFGLFSVMAVTALVIFGLSTTSHSLWDSGQDHPNLSDGLNVTSERRRSKIANSSDDFDTLAAQMAADWPRGSTVNQYEKQAVASDVTSCSIVGNDILNANGSAADAVIASALCSGVVHPYSSGLGGGVFIIYYDRATKTVFTIDGREVAPLSATEDMFLKKTNSTKISALFGWLALGVPGELAAMWTLHQRFGKLPWAELFRPAIKLAREGVTVTNFFGRILAFNKKYLLENYGDENMQNLLIDKKTGSTFVEGDLIRMPVLADTLEQIANDSWGIKEFYNGSIGERLVKDVQDGGGILQMADLRNYSVRIEQPIATTLKKNLTLYGLLPPSGNVILHYVLQILEGYNYDKPWDSMTADERTLFYHRLIEAMKFGFAQRTKLSDHIFNSEVDELVQTLLNSSTAEQTRRKIDDNQTFNNSEYYGGEPLVLNEGGTAHVSVMDKDGNAVSYSTSINNIFGAYRISKSTGITLNNHMDDFTTDPEKPNLFGVPPSQANKIQAGKRPQSSISPILILDGQGNVRLVAGGTGGTRILSGILNIVTRILFFHQDLKSALDAPRLHHQLFPAEAEYEKRFNESYVEALRRKGHKMVRSEAPQKYPYSAVEVIFANATDGKIYAVSDGRKGGLPDGF